MTKCNGNDNVYDNDNDSELKMITTMIDLTFRKRDLISRDDLVLPWRPLYDLVDFTFYSKHEAAGLKKHPL